MSEKILTTIAGTADQPIRIKGPKNDIEIPCYVLEDETRVLVQRAMVNALGMSRGSSADSGGDRLLKFTQGKIISPYITKEIMRVTENPRRFKVSGKIAYGYPATLLADLCDAVLAARLDGTLQTQQQHIAERCEVLMRGFARIGIIALVDEVTGYQRIRAKNALEKILDEWLTKELQPWKKTFPDEYYEQVFKLAGWNYNPDTWKRPSVIGRWTNDWIYDRLEYGLKKELHEYAERDEKGRLKHRLNQYFTSGYGYPRLTARINSIIGLMRAAPNMRRFKAMLQRAYPKKGDIEDLVDKVEEEKDFSG